MEFRELTKGITFFGKSHPTYLGCAVAGEVGELCNIIKKFERDLQSPTGYIYRDKMKLASKMIEQLSEESADVFIYLVLISRHFGFDLEHAIYRKIQVVQDRQISNAKKEVNT